MPGPIPCAAPAVPPRRTSSPLAQGRDPVTGQPDAAPLGFRSASQVLSEQHAEQRALSSATARALHAGHAACAATQLPGTASQAAWAGAGGGVQAAQGWGGAAGLTPQEGAPQRLRPLWRAATGAEGEEGGGAADGTAAAASRAWLALLDGVYDAREGRHGRRSTM